MPFFFLLAQTHSKNHFHSSQLSEALVLFNYCSFPPLSEGWGSILPCYILIPLLGIFCQVTCFLSSLLYELAGHDKGKPLNSFTT